MSKSLLNTQICNTKNANRAHSRLRDSLSHIVKLATSNLSFSQFARFCVFYNLLSKIIGFFPFWFLVFVTLIMTSFWSSKISKKKEKICLKSWIYKTQSNLWLFTRIPEHWWSKKSKNISICWTSKKWNNWNNSML